MIDYTSHDYESLKNRITELYKDKPGLGEGYEGSTGQTLIQLLADITDGLHYKLERRSQENYIATARLESSVWAAVSSFGYRPRRKVSASGKLLLRLLDEDGMAIPALGNIHIPYGKPITFNGVNFTPVQDYVIREGETEIELTIIQGDLESTAYNFDAPPFSDDGYFEVPDFRDIEEFSIKISTDQGEFYDVFDAPDGLRIRAISFATRNQAVYDIRYTKEKMRVIFGDDTFGQAPRGTMNVSWIRSLGSSVNVIGLNRQFEFESDTLTDDQIVTPQNQYEYEMFNITPINGGNDEESIQEIARSVPEYIRTNDRAVTNLDYEFWALRSGIGGILDMKAYGEAEINRLIFAMNNVYLSYVTPSRDPLNIEQLENLRDYMRKVKVNTTHLVIKPADVLFVGVNIKFRRDRSLPISNTQLYNELRNRTYEYFNVERDSIGKGFQHSEFIEYLQNLEIVFNGLRYMMTDFVKVSVDGVLPITIPSPVYDGVLTLSESYSVTPNDLWTVGIDGQNYTIVIQNGDSIATIVDRMKTKLFNETGLMFASPQTNQIRITHPANEGSYTITTGNGDLSEYTSFNQDIVIPRPTNTPSTGENLLLSGSVKVIDINGNEVLVDDGSGSVTNGSVASSVDYTKSRIQVPSLPGGDYFITFQQNPWQNFDVTKEAYIDIMPIFTEGDNPDNFFFSSIELLD